MLLQSSGDLVGLLPELDEDLLAHLRVRHGLAGALYLGVRPQLGEHLLPGVRVGDGLPVVLHLGVPGQLGGLPLDAAVLLLAAAVALPGLGQRLLAGLWVGHGLPGRLDLRVLSELSGLGTELVVALPAGPGAPQVRQQVLVELREKADQVAAGLKKRLG